MSESLIVEVRRLRDAQEAIKDRLETLLQMLGQSTTGAEDVGDLLDVLEDELARHLENQAA